MNRKLSVLLGTWFLLALVVASPLDDPLAGAVTLQRVVRAMEDGPVHIVIGGAGPCTCAMTRAQTGHEVLVTMDADTLLVHILQGNMVVVIDK